MQVGETQLKSLLTEIKALEGEPVGTIGGYASVYGNLDSHKDVILPGAFRDSLADIKSNNRKLKMYYNHDQFRRSGSSVRPIGQWVDFEDRDEGLYCKARLSAKGCEDYLDDVRNGLIDGFSIVYQVPAGGSIVGRKAGEPARTLTKIDLIGIDLVPDPSNEMARVTSVKSLWDTWEMPAAKATGLIDPEGAIKCLAHAMRVAKAAFAGGNSPSAEQRSEIFGKMSGAHKALSGFDVPPDMKHSPETTAEFREFLQESLGWSRTKASAVAGQGFRSEPRDEDESKAADPAEALKAFGALLESFSLSSK